MLAAAGDAVTLGAFASASALALLASALLARRARKRVAPRPKRKTFEAGRARAFAHPPRSHAEAVERLRRGEAGRVHSIEGDERRMVVAVRRPRRTTCAAEAGHVGGLFEGAWARDVRVEHAACGGRWRRGACTFVVSVADLRAAAGPIRGS